MITRGVLLHTHMNPVTVGFEIKFLDVDRCITMVHHGTLLFCVLYGNTITSNTYM